MRYNTNKLNKMNSRNKLLNDERGVAAFFVTLLVMIILSIIVISFSQIARRESTQALNRQLSTEAYYAAESGVNDAYASILTDIHNGGVSTIHNASASGGCSNYYSSSPTLTSTFSSSYSSKYTCVLVNATPPIQTGHPSPGASFVDNLQATTPFKTIDIAWTNEDGNGNPVDDSRLCSFTGSFLTNGTWSTKCPSVVQVDLVPITSSFTLNTIENSFKNIFLYPTKNAVATPLYSSLVNGSVYSADCSKTYNYQSCNYRIDVSSLNLSNYYLRVQYFYNSSPYITISGTDNLNNSIKFQDGEAVIDSTGLATGVLRRILVVVPLTQQATAQPPAPNNALETQSTVCKRLFLTKDTSGNDQIYEDIPAPEPSELSNLGIGSGSHLVNPSGGIVTNNSDPCNPYFIPGYP